MKGAEQRGGIGKSVKRSVKGRRGGKGKGAERSQKLVWKERREEVKANVVRIRAREAA